MPKSKRPRTLALTRTKKAGMARKEKLVTNIRAAVEECTTLVVVGVCNMRSGFLQDVRTRIASADPASKSHLFLGRNKIMQFALGHTPDDEFQTNLHQASRHLTGYCALCCSTLPAATLSEVLSAYKQDDFARAGATATHTVVLPKGPLHPPEAFPHSLESYLRTQLLMPTELRMGVVYLSREFQVCEEGKKLTPEQARVLKLLGRKMAKFEFEIRCVCTREGKNDLFEVEELVAASGEDGRDQGEGGEDEEGEGMASSEEQN